MIAHIRAIVLLVVLTLLLCSVLFPLVLLGVGQGLFPNRANGSIVEVDGKPVGSRLIAQSFTANHYFWSRPSAVNYDASASGASNWGASNPKLRSRVVTQLAELQKHADGRLDGVPADTVTTSGSGLDPNITLRNTRFQIDRVVVARATTTADRPRVRSRIEEILLSGAQKPLNGIADDEPLVNVLEVNLQLDREFPLPQAK